MWGDMILFNGAAGSPMPTRNVGLTEHQEKVIETLVGSGRYQNASEVIREGLRLVEQRAAEDALQSWRFCGRQRVSASARWIEASSRNSTASTISKLT
jgi:putative addiction module CopG family antidote